MDHIEEIRSGHGISIPYMSWDACSVHKTSDLVHVPNVDLTGRFVLYEYRDKQAGRSLARGYV